VNDQTLLFAFDRAGRPLTVSKQLVGGGSELLQQFTYDTAVGLGLGRLASAESWTRYTAASIGDVHTTEEYEYAGLRGNASAKVTTVAIDGVTTASTTQTYGWSPMGAIRELGYPSGMTIDDPARVVSHEYDSGFLTAIPGFANSLTYHDNLALASVGHSNGVTDWVGQDPDRMMRPAALWTSGVAGEENWNSGSYQFDGSGNIKAIGAQRFRYDAVSRLVEAKIWVPENNPPLNSFDDGFETGDTCNWEVRNAASGCVAGAHQLGLETYTYDPYGNLIARTTETTGGATEINTPADPQTNRLQGASTYDDEGNMTGWNLAQYDFNALGQMVRMRNGNQDWLFAYSTGGERILQVAEGGLGEKRWTVRDAAGRVLREWVAPAQGAPSWTRDWVYRGAQVLATVEPQPEELLDQAEGETSQVMQGAPLSSAVEAIRHLTLDHLGTPRLVTDEAGTNLAFHIYWPYGEEASDPLQSELRRKFTGHERDPYDLTSLADELDYLHARFSNPAVGRFLSVDPVSGAIRAPKSLNRYAYVLGSPVQLIDPDGEVPVVGFVVAGAIGAGLNIWAFHDSLPEGSQASIGEYAMAGLIGAGQGIASLFGGWAGFAGGGLGSALNQTVLGEVPLRDVDLTEIGISAVMGGALAKIGGSAGKVAEGLISPALGVKTGENIGATVSSLFGGMGVWTNAMISLNQLGNQFTFRPPGSSFDPSTFHLDDVVDVLGEAPSCGLFGCMDLGTLGDVGSAQGWTSAGLPNPFGGTVGVSALAWGLEMDAYHTGNFVGFYDLFVGGGLCIDGMCF
jgi:RHS repeat-associated protein